MSQDTTPRPSVRTCVRPPKKKGVKTFGKLSENSKKDENTRPHLRHDLETYLCHNNNNNNNNLILRWKVKVECMRFYNDIMFTILNTHDYWYNLEFATGILIRKKWTKVLFNPVSPSSTTLPLVFWGETINYLSNLLYIKSNKQFFWTLITWGLIWAVCVWTCNSPEGLFQVEDFSIRTSSCCLLVCTRRRLSPSSTS